jgi:GMP synthase-like glutamine amidotransferase
VNAHRALFVVHEANAGPGYLEGAARALGYAVEQCGIWKEPLPDPASYDLIVPLGSAEAAYDDEVAWLADELTFLRRAIEIDVPVVGVCFGAQALARALGGSVRPAEKPEVGWFMIDSADEDVVAPGPWLEWHFDTLTPPAGAQTLARSSSGIQAYQHGRHFGVQFHPEVSPDILASWIAESPLQLEALGVDAGAFQRETQRRAPQAQAAAHALFDRVLNRLGVSSATR